MEGGAGGTGLPSPHIRAAGRGTGTGLLHRSEAVSRSAQRAEPELMCPEQSALGGGHHSSRRDRRKQRPERGAPAWGTPWGRGGASPAGLAFQGPGETPQAPSLLPRRRRAGRAEEEQAAGLARGGPQEAALFLELRFKETQDARLSPTIVAAATATGPLPGGGSEDRVGQRPSPSPWTSGPSTVWPLRPGPPVTAIAGRFSNTPPPPRPCLCLWCLDGSFWAFPLDLAQRAPPPGSPPARHVGQLPTRRLMQPLWVSPTQP